MKQQVVVIHGGDAFETYEEYWKFLQSYEITLDNGAQSKGWKDTLQVTLGGEYEVIRPRMPNATNAKYAEWKLWFEKYIPFLRDDVILVGHSLGGVFLAKYLSEEQFFKRVRSTHIVAAPFDIDEGRRVVEFSLPVSLERFSQQGGIVFFYHSVDDPIVAYTEILKFKNAVRDSRALTFEGRGHFLQESFPELIENIREFST